MHLLVMVKSPEPGRVKTRLCPPCTPEEAADVAAAAIADTLEAVAACGATRKILALDGTPGSWIPAGFELIAQRGGPFADRLGAAWVDAGGPGVQIGMDTPQVSGDILDDALASLDRRMSAPGVGSWGDGGPCLEGGSSSAAGASSGAGDVAVLGPADDGGWWAIGLSRPDPRIFSGVPMSVADTCGRQQARLRELGWSVGPLPRLRDIDGIADLMAVAATIPLSRTARVAAALVATRGGRLDV